MFQDLRFGWRILRTNKMLALVAALSLGLGIGATSVIYALIDQLLIHDVTGREPEQLVTFNHGPWSSYPNFRDLHKSGVFAQLAADTSCYPDPRWREGDRADRRPGGAGTRPCADRLVRPFDLQCRAAYAGDRHPHGARRNTWSRDAADATRELDAGCGRGCDRRRRRVGANTLTARIPGCRD